MATINVIKTKDEAIVIMPEALDVALMRHGGMRRNPITQNWHRTLSSDDTMDKLTERLLEQGYEHVNVVERGLDPMELDYRRDGLRLDTLMDELRERVAKLESVVKRLWREDEYDEQPNGLYEVVLNDDSEEPILCILVEGCFHRVPSGTPIDTEVLSWRPSTMKLERR